MIKIIKNGKHLTNTQTLDYNCCYIIHDSKLFIKQFRASMSLKPLCSLYFPYLCNMFLTYYTFWNECLVLSFTVDLWQGSTLIKGLLLQQIKTWYDINYFNIGLVVPIFYQDHCQSVVQRCLQMSVSTVHVFWSAWLFCSLFLSKF